MSSLQYLNEKLSDAIYILTVHEGDACTRLARAWHKLLILSPSSFPKELQKDYVWVKSMIKKGLKYKSRQSDSPLPNKLTGIQNRTARKIIEKIVYIQCEINLLLEN